MSGRYRRIYSDAFLQAPFQNLNDGERVSWFYCRTGSQSTSVGIYRLSTAIAVEELGNVTAEEFERRLDVVCQTFGWHFDPAVRVLWIPSWLDENPPQSPNVVTSWRKLLNNVPDCTVKAEAVDAIQRALKDMPEAFRKAFGSYRVSLPVGIGKAQSQPRTHQGSGIQGSFREAGRQAGTEDKSPVENVPLDVQRVAQEVSEHTTENADVETLIDTFHFVYAKTYPNTAKPKRRVIEAGLRQAVLGRGVRSA